MMNKRILTLVFVVITIALLFSGCTTPDVCPTIPDCICPDCPDCVCPDGTCPDCVCPDYPACPDCPDCVCPGEGLPEISLFETDPDTICQGTDENISNLNWLVTGADVVLIDQDIGYVASAGSWEIDADDMPLGVTTYTLTATNSVGSNTATATITVTLLVHNTDTDEYYNIIQEAIDDDLTLAGHTIEVMAGTYDGFVVDKDNITIRATGEAIIVVVNLFGENQGIVIDASGVMIEGLKIDGSGKVTPRGIRGLTNAECTVENTTFTNLLTGIYANSSWNPIEPTLTKAELTATGNTFTNCWAGIGGTENTTLNAIEGNIFTDCVEGIGLGKGVEITVVPYDQLIAYLQDNNEFVDCDVDVEDYR